MPFLKKGFVTFLFCYLSSTYAAPVKLTSPWYLDTGIRYWLGDANFTFNLYDTLGKELISRLTYQNITTNSAEGFWQLQHESGVFFKGYVGGGSNLNGEFIDEDFPPEIEIYSRTQSEQKYGRLNYLSFDLGYALLQTTRYSLSPFIGYHYWFMHYNALGCVQTAENPDICAQATLSNTTTVISDNARWHSLRLGLNGNLQLSEHLKLAVDAAYIYAYLLGQDFHNLRPDIRGELFEGTGSGAQLDATLSWLAAQNLSFGVGGRWWYVKNNGYSHFEETAAQGYPQYLETTQNNYGLLVQSQYRFDEKNSFREPPHRWHGLFFGTNLGYGAYPNNIAIQPYATTPDSLASLSPMLIYVQSSGFLAGLQAGYQWRHNNLVWGIETDINYASIGGTNSISTASAPDFANHSVSQSLDWFGTVRGRFGQVLSNALLPYVTAGFSYAQTSLTHAAIITLISDEPLLSNSANRRTQNLVDWVAGAGLEYAVSNHLRYKLEYLHLGLGEPAMTTRDYSINTSFASNIVRLGINYQV